MDDKRGNGQDEWERLQQAFLGQWSDGVDAAGLGAIKGFADAFAKAVPPPPTEMPAPWQAFTGFAELLAEQAKLLRAGRKRKVEVAAAMKALLESLVRQIDITIAAQALAAGDKAMGLERFGLDRPFSDWPALGLARDWQLRLQRCWHALAAEREAGAHLRTLQWRALRAGCERCNRALSMPGPAITSLRGLYDLFVDQIEAAWRETAMTDEYARAFGASVNASLALRMAVRDLVQPVLGLLELAGRAELDAIERRLRDLESRVSVPAPAATVPVREAASRPAPASKPGRRLRAAPRAPQKTTKKAVRAEFDIASVIGRDDTK